MPGYYLMALDVEGKKCVVAGGGKVAARKALRLLEAGAQVVMVSVEFEGEILNLPDVHLKRKEYETDDLEGALLVIAATGDPEVNAKISRDARARGILVNVADEPKLSDFTVPAVMRRGNLLIGVSTSGASPAVASSIKEELEKQFGEQYGVYLEVIGELRSRVISEFPPGEKRREILRALARPEHMVTLKEKGEEAFRREMLELVLRLGRDE